MVGHLSVFVRYSEPIPTYIPGWGGGGGSGFTLTGALVERREHNRRIIRFSALFIRLDSELILKFDVFFLLYSTAKLNSVLFKCLILIIIFRKPMLWSTAHDEMLCREILVIDPFTGTRKSTVARGTKWEEVAENLNKIKQIYFKVDKRAVRDRYNLLSKELREKN